MIGVLPDSDEALTMGSPDLYARLEHYAQNPSSAPNPYVVTSHLRLANSGQVDSLNHALSFQQQPLSLYPQLSFQQGQQQPLQYTLNPIQNSFQQPYQPQYPYQLSQQMPLYQQFHISLDEPVALFPSATSAIFGMRGCASKAATSTLDMTTSLSATTSTSSSTSNSSSNTTVKNNPTNSKSVASHNHHISCVESGTCTCGLMSVGSCGIDSLDFHIANSMTSPHMTLASLVPIASQTSYSNQLSDMTLFTSPATNSLSESVSNAISIDTLPLIADINTTTSADILQSSAAESISASMACSASVSAFMSPLISSSSLCLSSSDELLFSQPPLDSSNQSENGLLLSSDLSAQNPSSLSQQMLQEQEKQQKEQQQRSEMQKQTLRALDCNALRRHSIAAPFAKMYSYNQAMAASMHCTPARNFVQGQHGLSSGHDEWQSDRSPYQTYGNCASQHTSAPLSAGLETPMSLELDLERVHDMNDCNGIAQSLSLSPELSFHQLQLHHQLQSALNLQQNQQQSPLVMGSQLSNSNSVFSGFGSHVSILNQRNGQIPTFTSPNSSQISPIDGTSFYEYSYDPVIDAHVGPFGPGFSGASVFADMPSQIYMNSVPQSLGQINPQMIHPGNLAYAQDPETKTIQKIRFQKKSEQLSQHSLHCLQSSAPSSNAATTATLFGSPPLSATTSLDSPTSCSSPESSTQESPAPLSKSAPIKSVVVSDERGHPQRKSSRGRSSAPRGRRHSGMRGSAKRMNATTRSSNNPLFESTLDFPTLSSSISTTASLKPTLSGAMVHNGRRVQVKVACVNCKSACKRCDSQRPCARCVRIGKHDTCTDAPRKERRASVPHETDQSLSRRASIACTGIGAETLHATAVRFDDV
ncbi:hypothetical protein QVD99_001536 [Batrachochytrium dendrobatidis]|nr:hypothetical protein QVD99_001536 [Batrachochytrium dendrobatidis]